MGPFFGCEVMNLFTAILLIMLEVSQYNPYYLKSGTNQQKGFFLLIANVKISIELNTHMICVKNCTSTSVGRLTLKEAL